MAEWGEKLSRPQSWIDRARDAFTDTLVAEGVVGSMPNIPANRINSQLDVRGPSFTTSSEELSGLRALEIARTWLEDGRIDAAVVGAVDLSSEAVHETLLSEVFDGRRPSDAACVLVLRRLADAEEHGLDVLAVLDDDSDGAWAIDRVQIRELFGHAHAADSLVDVGLAVHCCAHGVRPGRNGAGPWVEDDAPRRARVDASALGDQTSGITIASQGPPRPLPLIERPSIFVAEGESRDDVIAALRARDFVEAPVKRCRVALVATESSLSEKTEEAIRILETGRTFADGVHYREGTVEGEVAFVFTGSASPYPGMAADLVAHAPKLFEILADRVGGDLRTASQAEWVYEWGDAELATDPERQVWSASWVSQLHAGLSREVLGLKPDAAIGYSLGESNALFALHAWDDLGAMLHDLPESKLFRRELAGDHAAVRQAWSADGHVEAATSDGEIWQNWTVLGSVDRVREVVDEIPLCHVTIVNTDDECIIGGAPDACDEALLTLLEDPKIHASRLPYRVAIHAPEVAQVGDAYRKLHHRETVPVDGVRFYSNATGTTYELSRDACADALVGQATGTVDFPRTIRNAWEDGVRIFVEHGPRALCTGWVRRILGDREHLAVALDRQGVPAERHVMNVAAQLLVAGVDVDWRRFRDLLGVRKPIERKHPLRLPAHRPPVELGPSDEVTVMPHAPRSPFSDAVEVDVTVPTTDHGERASREQTSVRDVQTASPRRERPSQAASLRSPPSSTSQTHPVAEALRFQQHVANVHSSFMHRQAQTHEHFLALQQRGVQQLAAAYSLAPKAPPVETGAHGAQAASLQARSDAASQPALRGHSSAPKRVHVERPVIEPELSREELEYLAHGKISKIFGPEFAPQDDYDVQVRMPMPPLLLADRVVEIDAEPASMKPGRIITETDVTDESWYLHHGRMPAGIMIESGQADLLLVSYLGVDLLNRGERMYRLLGCQLTYTGPLPKPGETLRYDIEIDGFAKHGDVRLFFFHYDCMVGDEVRLQVRHGQAGFFTEEELEASGGILWTPEEGDHDPDAPVAEPLARCTKTSLTSEELHAFAEGRPWECFGEGWEFTKTHLRSPSIEPGRWVFLDRVTDLEYRGGPWGKGYLRAEADVSPDDWFFEGHFHNDPCMPGTLMFEAAIQAMAVYFAANGFTIKRDGWRFQPVQDVEYGMRCRGQCDPGSQKLVYEIFVEELDDGAEDGKPKLFADMLVTVDGLKAFWCRRMGLELVPDYPQAPVKPLQPGTRPLANEEQVRAIQLGRPSDAFGEMYEPFDGARSVPRLPGPPYDLVTRVREATGHLSMKPGAEIVAEYDVPADAWYFEEGDGEMPYGVLLEAGLQPCGWLASWVGCAATAKQDVFFRNLDGTGKLHRAVTPDDTMLTTTATLTKLSRSGPMTIVGFDVVTESAGDPIYEMETVFGFFPEEALASQAGITDDDPPEVPDLDDATELEEIGRLGLLTRATVSDDGGIHDAGRVVAQMDVDPGHWFFKAHFFTDPVQPGSLGLGLLLDALSMFGDRSPATSIGASNEHTWKYRGQVRPWNEVVTVDVHRRDDGLADGWLWVDGECIYRFENFDL